MLDNKKLSSLLFFLEQGEESFWKVCQNRRFSNSSELRYTSCLFFFVNGFSTTHRLTFFGEWKTSSSRRFFMSRKRK